MRLIQCVHGTKAALLTAISAIILGQPFLASAAVTDLTELTQAKGNKGFLWRPLDSQGNLSAFTLTARSSIDSSSPFNAHAFGSTGTIYVDKGDKGTGVQDSGSGGSKGISGKGGDQNEELIFTFDNPVSLDSIALSINDIDFGDGLNDKDDPVLFISRAGSGLFSTITEEDILSTSAFTTTDKKRGILDLGSLSSSLGYSAIDAFAIRETHGHIYVTGISEATPVPVPVPSTILLGSIGTVLVAWTRKRGQL